MKLIRYVLYLNLIIFISIICSSCKSDIVDNVTQENDSIMFTKESEYNTSAVSTEENLTTKEMAMSEPLENVGELKYSLPLNNYDAEGMECEPINWSCATIVDDAEQFQVWSDDINHINQMSPWVGGEDLKPIELIVNDSRYSAVLQDDTYIVKGNPSTGSRSLYVCKDDKAIEINSFYAYAWDDGKIWKYDLNGDGHEEYIKSYSYIATHMGERFRTSQVYIVDTANVRLIGFEDSDTCVIEMAQNVILEYSETNKGIDGYNFYLGFTNFYTYGKYITGENPTIQRNAWVYYGPDKYCVSNPQYNAIGMITVIYEYDATQDKMGIVSYNYSLQ